MDFDEVVRERRSVRKFHSKKPNWRHIMEAIDAGLRAPRAGDIGSVRFILVDDQSIIQELKDACQQDFVGEVHYVVVVLNDATDLIRSYAERGERYAYQETGAAVENFLLKLVDMGLAGCWIGSFDDDLVKRTLHVPGKVSDEVFPVAIIPIGYGFDKSPRKRMPSSDRSIYFNRYKNREMRPKKIVDP